MNGNALKNLADIKRICVSSVIIFATILTICLATQGCAQQQAAPQPPQTGLLATNTPVAPAQQPVEQQPVPVLDLEKQLLDFQRTLSQSAKDHQDFLEAQEDHHQKFLEWCYSFSVKFFSGCVVIIGLILTGLHFKTRGDIKKLVDERINTDIDAQIAKATKLTEKKIEAATKAAITSTDNFNKHLGGLQKEIQNRVNNLRAKFQTDNLNIIKLASVIARASVILAQYSSENEEARKISNQKRLEVIHLLKEIQNWAPTDRTIVIYIGRLYRQLGDYDAAIKELNAVIQKRISAGENKDQNYSDILFNKACYLNLKARKSEGEVREQFRTKAWETLAEAATIWPANLIDATKDDDFNDLPSPERNWKKLEQPMPPK